MKTVLVVVGALLSPLVLAPPPPKLSHTSGHNTLPPFDYREHLREHLLPQVFYFRSRAMFRRGPEGRASTGESMLVHEAAERRHALTEPVWLVESSEDQMSRGLEDTFDVSPQDILDAEVTSRPSASLIATTIGTLRIQGEVQRSFLEKPRTSRMSTGTGITDETTSPTKPRTKVMFTSEDPESDQRNNGGSGLQGGEASSIQNRSGSSSRLDENTHSTPPNLSSTSSTNREETQLQSNTPKGTSTSQTDATSSTETGTTDLFDDKPRSTSPLNDQVDSPVSDLEDPPPSVSGREEAQPKLTATRASSNRLAQQEPPFPKKKVDPRPDFVPSAKRTNGLVQSSRKGLIGTNQRGNVVLSTMAKDQYAGHGSPHFSRSGDNLVSGGLSKAVVTGLTVNDPDTDVTLSKVNRTPGDLAKGGGTILSKSKPVRVMLTGQTGNGGGSLQKNLNLKNSSGPPEKPLVDREINLDHRPLEGLPQLMDEVEQKFAEMGEVVDPTRVQQLAKVMAAWDAHRKKVEEGLGLEENEDTAERRPPVATTTTTPSSATTFQLFGTSRRVVGRSWRRIVSRLFPDSLKRMLLIFPGTIWCGAGNKANNDTERLGPHNETDACCREHDLNSDYIAAGQVAPDYGNIHNKYSFTMSSCESDSRFRECLLRNVAANGSDSSEAVGYLYFTIIKPKCFTKAMTAANCTEEKERCGRSSDLDATEWTIRENPDFPEPDPRNRLLDAVLAALSTIRYLFPRGLAESSGSIPILG